ncbi:PQQ-dependent sugar dehydrogenase [Kriegella aquimaris]|uniref:Por secretion system C-terminal sorting domain-containing protein n=1 Tax=Kriegella aquimaris TaxID=192904 RepID=A0A1G9XZG5_9FLAO|nr:PQQ-dependent sugar dehydrogenase [Kriegella aquimaris]SDN02252.1 Por secretion system C-terminal sorting domain-containing protein [Kriegella aquimaris]
MKKTTILGLLYFVLIPFLRAQDPVTYEQAFPNLTFEFPLEIQNANDGSNRLFVVEQSGKIKVFDNNNNTSTQSTFIDVKNKITFSSGQEIGLLGLAFHPNYKQNGYFYVYHTKYGNTVDYTQAIVVARYQVSSSNPNQADVSSRLELFEFEKTYNSNNHNGGKIAFGPDGYLYIAVGDGGGYSDPNKNAQNLDVAYGSILRIDVDLNGNNQKAINGNYEIPSDNPRVGKSGMDEIYAWGLRNTWKFSFDSQTNRLWGADVGQDAYEEINLITKGGNYGWNRYEGNSTESSSTNLTTSPDIKPVFQYNHDNGDVSITGGYVYRGASNNTSLQGKYIFADYLSGRVWSLNYNSANNSATSELLFRTNGQYISSFGLDESGELYFSGYGSTAKIFKIVGGNVDPSPDPTTVAIDGVGDWKAFENGTNGIVESIVVDENDVYVAGNFSKVGSLTANNIAQYNINEGWKTLSTGANGKVTALAIAPNGNLYAGGEFTSIGGVSASNVAVWNGSSWASLGSGTNGTVAEIVVDNQNKVYVAGGFESAGGKPVKNIALWSNGSWSSLADSGTGDNGTNNEIRALAIDENNLLYVGGNFDVAGGKSALRIATWNGSSWGTLGDGTNGFVQAIVTTPDYIYAGGNFSIAGGKTVNRVARWARTSRTWEALGNGVSGNVNTMVYKDSHLYVGGNFETAANDSNTNYIVKNVSCWSASKGWEAMGPSKDVGVNNLVSTIVFSGDEEHIFTGGNFNTAGETTVQNMAVWGQNFDCSDERLNVEYRLDNGNWTSVGASLTVDEGTKLELRLSTSAQSYLIVLPNENGEVDGEHNLETVTVDDDGVYEFNTNSGCTTTFRLNVIKDDFLCDDNSIIAEYQINGAWQSGNGSLQVDPGDKVVLSMLPNGIGLTITLPDGSAVGDNYQFGSVSEADSGIYVFTSEQGCKSTLNLVVGTPVDCSVTLIPEYNVNGTWQSGTEDLQVQSGTKMVLSAIPNSANVTITLPDGSIVGDNFNLGKVTEVDAGTYLITSDEGCTTQLNLSVGNGTIPTDCDGELIPEYNVNGVWKSGATDLQVEAGDSMVLSMLPNGIGLTITLPDGSTVGDNYSLRSITEVDSGIYILTSEEGCSKTFNLSVASEVNEECTSLNIIPEYRINNTWYNGSSEITLDVGTGLLLSMLPNGKPLAITLPNGTVVGDNYYLGKVSAADSGTYILSSEGECRALTVAVTDLPNCSTGATVPEYYLGNVWSSGENLLQVEEGEDLILSMQPNGVDLTITLPNGNKVGDNHVIRNITASDAGVYILEPANGCKTTIQLFVTAEENAKAVSLLAKVVDDGSFEISESLITAYPNPTANKVFIELGETKSTSYELVIHDIKQQQVYSEQIENNQSNRLEIDLSGYSEGIYFVSIRDEKGEVSTQKIVKTR